jgi:hypothetical protein
MNNTNDVIPYDCDHCGTPVVDHNWKLPKPVPGPYATWGKIDYLCDTCWDAVVQVEDEEEEPPFEYDCDE